MCRLSCRVCFFFLFSNSKLFVIHSFSFLLNTDWICTLYSFTRSQYLSRSSSSSSRTNRLCRCFVVKSSVFLNPIIFTGFVNLFENHNFQSSSNVTLLIKLKNSPPKNVVVVVLISTVFISVSKYYLHLIFLLFFFI